MKKRAYIIDAYSKGNFHEVINQGYLMMISRIYKEVIYVADVTSCHNLKNLLDRCGIDYSNVTFQEKYIPSIQLKTERTGFQGAIYRLLVSWLNFLYYMRTSKNADVFYNNNPFYAIILIQWLLPLKKNRIFAMCHSEMEHLNKNTKYGISLTFHVFLLRFMFKHMKLSKRFTFMVLSSDMAEFLRGIVAQKNRNRIDWIDHCYMRPKITEAEVLLLPNEHFKIGIPGAINKTRGLEELNVVLNNINRNDVRIYNISFTTDTISNEHYIHLNDTGKLLPFETYQAYIRQMDAVILLYKKDSYKLTASGAFLEAIWNEKPIIAISNHYFRYIFRKFGDIGILAESAEELANIISKINPSDFQFYITNIRKAKEALLPKNVEGQLRSVIERKP